MQDSKILPTISPICRVNPSISRRCVGDILREENKINGRTKHVKVKWLKGVKLEDLQDALVIWIGK
jgi:hypothetical protein